MNTQAKIEEILSAISEKIRAELRLRCEVFKPDLKMPEVFNVLTALLARQATIALQFCSAPQLWNQNSAPLFLRAMADVHITLAWILMDPPKRVRQYIDHGLGQAVLELEHRKKQMEAGDENKLNEELVKSCQAWIDSQRWNFLVDVNIGSWSGKSTRVMAEEAGIIDFYNYVYSPFSQCVHSTWYHVGRYNSTPSDSPYTRLLWMPAIADLQSDFWDMDLVLKYLDKSFNAFDEKALATTPSSDVRGWVRSETDRLVEEENRDNTRDSME